MAMDDGPFHVDREELAWAAGLFDEEGCFSYTEKAGFASVSVIQVDRRVLDRFQLAVGGMGKIYGPYASSPKSFARKPQFQYRAYRREHIQAIAALLWCHLGPVKREQAAKVLRKLKKRCSKGHPLVQARGCPKCVADAWERKRSSEKIV